MRPRRLGPHDIYYTILCKQSKQIRLLFPITIEQIQFLFPITIDVKAQDYRLAQMDVITFICGLSSKYYSVSRLLLRNTSESLASTYHVTQQMYLNTSPSHPYEVVRLKSATSSARDGGRGGYNKKIPCYYCKNYGHYFRSLFSHSTSYSSLCSCFFNLIPNLVLVLLSCFMLWFHLIFMVFMLKLFMYALLLSDNL